MFAKVFRFSGRQPSTRLDFCTKSRSNWSYFYKKPIKMSIYSYSGLSESSFLVTLQIFTTAFGHNAITPTTVIIVMTNNQIRHCYGISMVGEHTTTTNSERRIGEIDLMTIKYHFRYPPWCNTFIDWSNNNGNYPNFIS